MKAERRRRSGSDFWDQPDQIRKKPGRGHFIVVRLMRYVLPLGALALVAVVMAWPQIEKGARDLTPAPTANMPKIVRQNELLNPRFESEDNRQQPFLITAARAVQSIKNPDAIDLENPEAEVKLKSGAYLYASARTGHYIQKQEHLLLQGEVTLRRDDGYELRTEEVLLNMKQQKAWGDMPVEGEGPAGSLKATGFSMDVQKDILVFTGPARLVIYQDKMGF